jgi:hypothetical protein
MKERASISEGEGADAGVSSVSETCMLSSLGGERDLMSEVGYDS